MVPIKPSLNNQSIKPSIKQSLTILTQFSKNSENWALPAALTKSLVFRGFQFLGFIHLLVIMM
jgi:hypothetical protein